MTAQIPEQLLAYFAERDAQRVAEREDFLARLTDREKALMREAAVLAYVHGRHHPLDAADPHPKDSAVFAQVIDAALRMPDLYPAINHVAGRIDLPHPEDRCGDCGHFRGAHDAGRCEVCDEDRTQHPYSEQEQP